MEEFNANYKEINIYIDGVYCYEDSFGIYSNGLNSYDFSKNYVVFNEVEPGFYRWEKTDEKPENNIYVDLNEKVSDIDKNHCEGPETKAYMVLKVYNGIFEIKEVYINSIPLDEYYYKAQNDEIDIARYDYYIGNEHYDDYYEYYDEELDEYVTEPYVA